jgi:type I restriction enzyme S subunit
MVSIDYPDKQTANKFNEICQHLFNKIWINQDQINNLEQIRDSLLPRLMSGKIRVPVEVN